MIESSSTEDTLARAIERGDREAIAEALNNGTAQAIIGAPATLLHVGDRRSMPTRRPAESSAHSDSSCAAAAEIAEFNAQYARRAGVEGTHSRGIRRCGLRRSHDMGLAKTPRQHIITALALSGVIFFSP
jgi:hypothetical protein